MRKRAELINAFVIVILIALWIWIVIRWAV